MGIWGGLISFPKYERLGNIGRREQERAKPCPTPMLEEKV